MTEKQLAEIEARQAKYGDVNLGDVEALVDAVRDSHEVAQALVNGLAELAGEAAPFVALDGEGRECGTMDGHFVSAEALRKLIRKATAAGAAPPVTVAAIRVAVELEREACAKLAHEMRGERTEGKACCKCRGYRIAAAIRGRGKS